MRKLILVIFAFAAYNLLHTTYIYANDYYVSPTGSDTNPGTLTSPWLGIINSYYKLHAGDTLYIRSGTYRDRIYTEDSTNGTATNPITITSYPGEEVILDGGNTYPPNSSSGLIQIYGSWITVKNITITRSAGLGVVLKGQHDTVDNLYVHHNLGSGIILSGNYDIAQNSRVWYNSAMNENGQSPQAWGSGLSCARYPHHCTIRHNTVWDNWGEGISTFETIYTTIEDNVSYNNQINYYISDTKYSYLQRNLAYCTPGNPIDLYYPQFGIAVWDEKGIPIATDGSGDIVVPVATTSADFRPYTREPTSDNTLINNLIKGCDRNFGASTGESDTNNLYAFNTFVNAAGTYRDPYNIWFYAGTNSNAQFINNIIVQENSIPIGNQGTNIQFSHNLWSKTPPTTMIGTFNLVANPLLTNTNLPIEGQVSANDFRLMSGSPAHNQATFLTKVAIDFFQTIRDQNPDIGAIEYVPDYRNFQNFLLHFTNIFDFNLLVRNLFK